MDTEDLNNLPKVIEWDQEKKYIYKYNFLLSVSYLIYHLKGFFGNLIINTLSRKLRYLLPLPGTEHMKPLSLIF